MSRRAKIPREIVADVVSACRRRCCVCYALRRDPSEKRGQIAHVDRDPVNDALDNLAFLCLEHHDQYDSRTSQSKGLTEGEVKRYRTELLAFVAQTMSPSDDEIVAVLAAAVDRPAYRTPFHGESPLPRFRNAIAETIETLNTGKTPQGAQLPAKTQIRDPRLRRRIEDLVRRLVALRATFDDLFARAGSGTVDARIPTVPCSSSHTRLPDTWTAHVDRSSISRTPSIPPSRATSMRFHEQPSYSIHPMAFGRGGS